MSKADMFKYSQHVFYSTNDELLDAYMTLKEKGEKFCCFEMSVESRERTTWEDSTNLYSIFIVQFISARLPESIFVTSSWNPGFYAILKTDSKSSVAEIIDNIEKFTDFYRTFMDIENPKLNFGICFSDEEVNGNSAIHCMGLATEYSRQTSDDVLTKRKNAMSDNPEKLNATYFSQRKHSFLLERMHFYKLFSTNINAVNFIVYYQPQISMAGRIIGLEALIRCKTEDGTVHGPNAFLPCISELHLENYLYEKILTQVCEDIAYLPREDITVSINVDAAQLLSKSFADLTLSILKKKNIGGDRIKIEILEYDSVLTLDDHIDQELMPAAFGLLKEAGIRFAADDVGEGYHTFSTLHRLLVVDTLDTVKFAKEYMEQEGPFVSQYVHIANFANNTDVSVIIEGVENSEQLTSEIEQLIQAGIDDLGKIAFQGYYFSKPLPLEGIKSLQQDEIAKKLNGYIVKEKKTCVKNKNYISQNIVFTPAQEFEVLGILTGLIKYKGGYVITCTDSSLSEEESLDSLSGRIGLLSKQAMPDAYQIMNRYVIHENENRIIQSAHFSESGKQTEQVKTFFTQRQRQEIKHIFIAFEKYIVKSSEIEAFGRITTLSPWLDTILGRAGILLKNSVPDIYEKNCSEYVMVRVKRIYRIKLLLRRHSMRIV